MFEILQNKDPYENFQKAKCQDEMIRFWCDSKSRPSDYKSGPLPLLYFTQGNFAENISHVMNLRFVGSNPTKTVSFHLEIWFFEIFHRGPYFVGFQTKWIMAP